MSTEDQITYPRAFDLHIRVEFATPQQAPAGDRAWTLGCLAADAIKRVGDPDVRVGLVRYTDADAIAAAAHRRGDV